MIITTVLFFILINNMISLYPLVFSLFSILNFTIILTVVFFGGVVYKYFLYFLKNFITHLTPLNTPLAIISFMVIVEFIRQFIRPLTLLFRLTINLATGHLLIILVSFMSIFRVFIQIPLFLLEFMVSFIQRYVFTILLIIYFKD